MKKRCYVAGRLNSDACGYIKNVHNIIIRAEEVRKLGYAVFVPGVDFLCGVVLGDWDYEDYFDNSQFWLDVSDCMFVTPGWEKSNGTKREIERATEKGIPVFYNLTELREFLKEV